MRARFNPPPGWPQPPVGWEPNPGWLPDANWPDPPAGWQFWVADDEAPTSTSAGSAAYTVPLPFPVDAPMAAEAAKTDPSTAKVFGWAGLLLLVIICAATGGFSAACMAFGLYIGAVALVGLIRGQVGWAQLNSRGRSAAALVAAVVAIAVGGAASAPATPSAPMASSVTTATSSPTPKPSPTTDLVEAAIAQADPGTALATVAQLKVKARGSKSSYYRTKFGPTWSDTDGNGCDQRNDILRRDLLNKTLQAGTDGCTVVTGTLHDPYTGKIIRFKKSTSSTSPVQVDHVVSLTDAWEKGARTWPQSKRIRFANDPLNLVAVQASVIETKNGEDAAAWLPSTSPCRYVARQVAVKRKYGLWVTGAERKTVARTLVSCPTRALPVTRVIALGGAPLAVVKRAPTPTPVPVVRHTRPAKPKPKAPSYPVVHPGAFCAPEGAFGVTTIGTLMHCTSVGGAEARWRRA